MITEEQYNQQHDTLYLLLDPIYGDDNEFALFYGYHDPWFGWHIVSDDYSNFFINRLGATYDEALGEAEKIRSDFDSGIGDYEYRQFFE